MTAEISPGREHVVVGVDGSDASVGALRWAIRYAEAFDRPVLAVGVWQYPVTYRHAPTVDIGGLERRTASMLAETVGKVVADGVRVPVETAVRQGHPAEVLIREARTAELLVMGSRGHGAFAGMLLGSVGAHCAHHAPCPLVIVRPPGIDGQP
jgi:nucleotide-binding universal stress UspA family protein